jgi:hypothetical protein
MSLESLLSEEQFATLTMAELVALLTQAGADTHRLVYKQGEAYVGAFVFISGPLVAGYLAALDAYEEEAK